MVIKLTEENNVGSSEKTSPKEDAIDRKTDRVVEHLRIPEDVKLILHHQKEHYDGNGVPSGLQKEEIPIGARIVSIVDALDEMLIDGRNEEEALMELANNSRTRFDPLLVDSLLEIRNWKGKDKKSAKIEPIDPLIKSRDSNAVDSHAIFL